MDRLPVNDRVFSGARVRRAARSSRSTRHICSMMPSATKTSAARPAFRPAHLQIREICRCLQVRLRCRGRPARAQLRRPHPPGPPTSAPARRRRPPEKNSFAGVSTPPPAMTGPMANPIAVALEPPPREGHRPPSRGGAPRWTDAQRRRVLHPRRHALPPWLQTRPRPQSRWFGARDRDPFEDRPGTPGPPAVRPWRRANRQRETTANMINKYPVSIGGVGGRTWTYVTASARRRRRCRQTLPRG